MTKGVLAAGATLLLVAGPVLFFTLRGPVQETVPTLPAETATTGETASPELNEDSSDGAASDRVEESRQLVDAQRSVDTTLDPAPGGTRFQLRVQVTSETGASVDAVPIVVYRLVPSPSSMDGAGFSRRAIADAKAVTDADGFAPVQPVSYRPRDLTRLGTLGQLAVSFDFPHEPRVEAVFWDVAEIRTLPLPPTGSVEVRVEGLPVDHRSRVTLYGKNIWDMEKPGSYFPLRGGRPRRGHFPLSDDCPLKNGRVQFPRVGAGLELWANLYSPGIAFEVQSPAGGPTQAGERVVLTLDASRCAIVRGVLVDEQAQAIASAKISVKDTRQSGDALLRKSNSASVETSPDGGFVALVPLHQAGECHTLIMEFQQRKSVVDLGPLQPREQRNLGVIALGSGPVLASGTVVDEGGRPVEGAGVRVRQNPQEKGSEPSASDGFRVPFVYLRAASDSKGRFEILGTAERGGLELVAMLHGYTCPAPTPFEPGQRGTVVRLHTSGQIEVSFAVKPAMLDALRNVRVGLTARPPTPRKEVQQGAPRTSTGRMSFANLAPGSYDVVVQFGSRELLRVEEVLVEPGVVTKDPRLQDLMLSAFCREIFLDVVDEHGAHLPGDVSVQMTNGREWSSVKATDSNTSRFQLLVGAEPVELKISMAGRRTVVLKGVESDTRAVLPRGYPIHLRWSGPMPDLEANHALGAVLQLTDEDHARHGLSRPRLLYAPPFFDGVEGVTVVAELPGRYVVSWMICRKEGGWLRGETLVSEAAIVTVRDTPAPQSFSVRFDGDLHSRTGETYEQTGRR